MTPIFIENDAFKRLQDAYISAVASVRTAWAAAPNSFDQPAALQRLQDTYLSGVAAVKAAWVAGLPDPTLPPVPPPPPPVITWAALATNSSITLLGSKWTVQSGTPDGVQVGSDGEIEFRAKSGDHAVFDPPRKIRAEMASARTYAKGEPISFKGSFTIDVLSILGADWCSVVQVHQADTRRADGTAVEAAPEFSLGIILVDGQPWLQVRAETEPGVPLPHVYPPMRELGRAPITVGVEHAFEVTYVSGHGGPGVVKVSLDGRTVVDFAGPTGYEYPDLLASVLYGGKLQSTGSYPKVGIYSGANSGDVPPPGVNIQYRFKFAV